MITRLALLTAVVALAATCPRSEPMSPDPTPDVLDPVPGEPDPTPDVLDPVPGEPEPQPDEPPEDPFAPTFGERVTREAWYRVSPVAGGKRLQAVTLEFDGGEAWIRAYRPLRSELRFVDKRVVIVGRPYWPSPNVQHVAGTHFEVESIELAPGETPWDPEPTLIPPPPFARSADEAKARAGDHAQCRGEAVDGVFHFPDGSSLPMAPLGSFFDVVLPDGDQTVLAWVDDDGTLHARAACPGEAPRCGMSDDNMRD